jgi:hypothetical protein
MFRSVVCDDGVLRLLFGLKGKRVVLGMVGAVLVYDAAGWSTREISPRN